MKSIMQYQGWARDIRIRTIVGALGILVVFGVVLAQSAKAQTYEILYSFQCYPNDGQNPAAGLVLDSTGNLYGTTQGGGAYGYGTVFELSGSGTETVLHSFASYPTDGGVPLAGLIRDPLGNLYGTTSSGGTSGNGTVFELSPSGTETILYTFGDPPSDGTYPDAGLLRDGAGNFYGTTSAGGSSGFGIVFKLTHGGAESVLHYFVSSGFAATPAGGLVRDAAGNLYGTTQYGGYENEGILFEIVNGSNQEVDLLNFAFDGVGSYPVAGLVSDKAGNFYGTTKLGGAFRSGGVVFKLDTNRAGTVLFSFNQTANNGGFDPQAGLLIDAGGNLYGTTAAGGSSACNGGGCGVVFALSPAGQETVLHRFLGPPKKDGQAPLGGLVADSAGNFYGTTSLGGANGCGTVFKLGR